MAKAGYTEIRTSNGGVLKADNARTKDSIKAQATPTWGKVTAIKNGREVQTSKIAIQKDIFKANMHKLIDKI